MSLRFIAGLSVEEEEKEGKELDGVGKGLPGHQSSQAWVENFFRRQPEGKVASPSGHGPSRAKPGP